MDRITIVIPTYWSWPNGQSGSVQDAIFDHPTALDREGTLVRCLESLRNLEGPPFQVLIITAAVNPQLTEAVESRVEQIMAPFKKDFPILQFAPSDLIHVRKVLYDHGLETGLAGLGSYAEIRNCQLLGAAILGSDLIVGIDDDETVPGDYLRKALVGLEEKKIPPIDGLAGVYLDQDGGYLLKETDEARRSSNIFIRKAILINDQFSAFFNLSHRIVETVLALGGNMVFTEKLFRNVAFDPGITRGEDIDYLLNSKLLGYHWYLDKELTITHLPPPKSPDDPPNTSEYAKLQQDILRFLYQKEKIRLSLESPSVVSLETGDFGIYPGTFFREDVESQALEALQMLCPSGSEQGHFLPPEQLMRQARERARRAGSFLCFNEAWKQAMERLTDDPGLREQLRKKV